MVIFYGYVSHNQMVITLGVSDQNGPVSHPSGDLSPSLGLKFSDVPSGFAAFSKVPLSGWAQMVAFAGTVELFQYVDDPKRAWDGPFATALTCQLHRFKRGKTW